jgi:hypothetical protein
MSPERAALEEIVRRAQSIINQSQTGGSTPPRHVGRGIAAAPRLGRAVRDGNKKTASREAAVGIF